jgi:sulfate permease, SulP family
VRQTEQMHPDVKRFAPAIRPYRREWLRSDIGGGLAAGAVVIPQAMAYATVAGMPVQTGLYTAMVPLVVYAFVGGSRTASVTTTSTIATLSASTMVAAGIAANTDDPVGHLVTLTLLVGVILLIARLCRLGSIVENINQATLLGIKFGVGLTVAAAQLPHLLGIDIDAGHDGFFRLVWAAVRHLGQAHPATVALSLGSIVLLLVLGRWAPSIPGPLVVVAAGITLTVVAHLADHGVALIPEVPRGLPLPVLPNLGQFPALIPGALAIAMMAFLETVAVARSVRRPDEPRVDADRELLASSLAALVGSFFRALPPAGGFSQTLVNVRAGARSQIAGLVTAALAVLVALFLAPLLGKLPQAVLAAMVFVAVLGLVDIAALRVLYRFEKHEFALAAIVAVLGLTTGLLAAVAGGVALTLYSVLREMNRSHVVQLTRADGHWLECAQGAVPGSADPLVVRTRVGLYTANLRANTDRIRDLVADCSPQPRTLVWDLSQQPVLTSTVLDGLREAEGDLADIRVVYAGLPADIHATAQRWPWWQDVESQGRYFATVDEAAQAT